MERSRKMNRRVGLQISATILTLAVGCWLHQRLGTPILKATCGGRIAGMIGRVRETRDKPAGKTLGMSRTPAKDTGDSPAECRRDKRDIKQDARGQARDIKRN
jgi:hypothetical protein